MPTTRLAFSTVACPDWTLDQVADAAGQWGFEGVELRTRGHGSNDFACDPALTAPEKIRSLLDDAGIAISSLATTLTFDKPIRPKVFGYAIGDHEQTVRQAKRMIDLAAQIDCPFVRVFGFEVQPGATRPVTIELIESRLRMVVDHADKTGVKVALENGGSFPTAADLRQILDRINSPLLVASYSLPVALSAGEGANPGIAALSDRLALVKVKDTDAGAAVGACDWIVYEYDRAFIPGLPGPETVLPQAAKAIFRQIAALRSAAPPAAARGA